MQNQTNQNNSIVIAHNLKFLFLGDHLLQLFKLLLFFFFNPFINKLDFPCGSAIIIFCNAGDVSLLRGLDRSLGEGNCNSLKFSWLENPMDREAWWAIVRGATGVGHDLVTNHHYHH